MFFVFFFYFCIIFTVVFVSFFQKIIAQPSGAVQFENGKATDQGISCKFWRERLTTIKDRQYDLVNTPYHLLVASGKSIRGKFASILWLYLTSSRSRSKGKLRTFSWNSGVYLYIINIYRQIDLGTWNPDNENKETWIKFLPQF